VWRYRSALTTWRLGQPHESAALPVYAPAPPGELGPSCLPIRPVQAPFPSRFTVVVAVLLPALLLLVIVLLGRR
jgi:hypothetical protein